MNTGLRTAKEGRAARKAEFIKLVTHRVREPLGPLLFALDVLQQEEWVSPRAVEMIRLLQRGVEEEARAIEEMLSLVETFVTASDSTT